MVARNETIIKWILFGTATVLLCLLQGILQNIAVLGIIPFLFPAIVAVIGMFEGVVPGTVCGLVIGVLCDLTIPSVIPCFYTLIFPAAGLIAALIARSWIPAGFLCSLITTVTAFFLTDGFYGILLALLGKHSWYTVGLITLKETALTLPFVIPVFLLLRSIHVKCHMYD